MSPYPSLIPHLNCLARHPEKEIIKWLYGR